MIEVVGYFAFFWLFLFSSRYRALQMEEWNNGGWFGRIFMVIEAITSTIIGLILPLALLWTVLRP